MLPENSLDFSTPMRRTKVMKVTVQLRDGKVFLYTTDRVLMEVQSNVIILEDKRTKK